MSILDCMMEPSVEEPNTYCVYYHILDGDRAGRAPTNPSFERKHKSCLQRIAKSGDKVSKSNSYAIQISNKAPIYGSYIKEKFMQLEAILIIIL